LLGKDFGAARAVSLGSVKEYRQMGM
jgi:hypothetical protein